MKPTAPYAPGNEASREAAHAIERKLTGTRNRVLTFIAGRGDHGATGTEIATALDILPYTAKPRCTELKQAGYIIDSGRMRDNTTGSGETVWCVAPPGERRPIKPAKKAEHGPADIVIKITPDLPLEIRPSTTMHNPDIQPLACARVSDQQIMVVRRWLFEAKDSLDMNTARDPWKLREDYDAIKAVFDFHQKINKV